MNRFHHLGWWAFGLLLGANILSATLPSADAQLTAEPGRGSAARARCVSVATTVGKDGNVLVFRAFEDGTIEERRAETIRDGKVIYTWKPALHPAD